MIDKKEALTSGQFVKWWRGLTNRLSPSFSAEARQALKTGKCAGYFPGDDRGPNEDDGLFPKIF